MDKKYLSKIVNGTDTLYIKDEEAREALSGLTSAMHYVGVTTTALVDGSTTSTIVIDGENHQAASGDVVIYGELELVWSGSKWQELGSTGSIKALAFKDNADGDYTPAGQNAPSAVSFAGTASDNFVTGYNNDAVAATFTEGAFTPAEIQAGFVTPGVAATYSHSGFEGGSLGAATTDNFATEGVVASYAEASETLTLSAASKTAAVTAQGTFTPAVYGTDTFNGGTPTAIDTTKFNGGSKAADTFNAGSAATLATSSAITDLGTATAAAQTFTGTQATIVVD
jgi:hypothetical protein